MADDRIRIGILGAGEMARKHLESLKHVKNAVVAGVAGASEKSLSRIRRDFPVETFENISDLYRVADAIDICLPTFMHSIETVRAAGEGLHVLCEKPMALSLEEADDMVAACEASGVTLMIAHCLRFWPEYEYLLETASSGRLGKILSISAWRFGGFPDWASRGWLLDSDRSGGPTIDLMIHDIDIIRALLGMPDAVTAHETDSQNVKSVMVDMRFDCEQAAHVESGWYMPHGYEFRQGYRAVFEGGVIEFHSDREPPLIQFEPGTNKKHVPVPHGDAYIKEIEYFADCVIRAEKPVIVPPEQSKDSLSIALAAMVSSIDGEPSKP